jgi:methyltransferase family protein
LLIEIVDSRVMMGSLTIWFRRLDASIRFRASEIVRRLLRKLIEIAITDLDLMARFRDLTSSVAFEQDYLSNATAFKGRTQFLRWVLDQTKDDHGLYLEFGVYQGDSINLLADLKPNVNWLGFDSFVGLPEDWAIGAKAGAFSIGEKLPPVRTNVRLIKGFFEDTLPSFVDRHRGAKIAFLHIDCDLYSSTKTVLTWLKDMLGPGSIIVFDELINYPGWQDHEYRAFMEYVAEQNISYEYIGYVRTSCRVAVRLTGVPALAPSEMPQGLSVAPPQ